MLCLMTESWYHNDALGHNVAMEITQSNVNGNARMDLGGNDGGTMCIGIASNTNLSMYILAWLSAHSGNPF